VRSFQQRNRPRRGPFEWSRVRSKPRFDRGRAFEVAAGSVVCYFGIVIRNRTAKPKPKASKNVKTKVSPEKRRTKGARAVPPPTQRAAPSTLTLVQPSTAANTPGPVVELTPVTVPEPAFAARVLPAEPQAAVRLPRRAIFFDVENSSRAEHISAVVEHLKVDRLGHLIEIFAVGNWRVIGQDTARLLARLGAHLVHSAPSVGVRDWSDLRIAVSAGVWLAGARPGDTIEIITDDQAFDAVGDVAANLGIGYRRMSYRALVSLPSEPVVSDVPPSEARSRRRRRRGGRRGRPEAAPRPSRPTVVAVPSPAVPSPPSPPPGLPTTPVEPQTAPHDEIVAVVRSLMAASGGTGVSLDALANALRSEGFRRTPGSPRLITRLRRIKELALDRNGTITFVELPARQEGAADGQPEARAEPEAGALTPRRTGSQASIEPASPVAEGAVLPVDADEPTPGNEKAPGGDGKDKRRPHRWQRYRRGGRRWRRPGGETAVAPAPAS
jgi:hypothetical protein